MECRRLVSTGEQPRWIWMSSGHCLWDPAAPGLSPGLPVRSCLPPRAEALGPVPASLLALQEGQFGGDVSGASPDTHRVCWGGGSPGPAHPPSQPSSPLPPLQLHPGRQHSHPKQVTCPPPGAAYPCAQAVTHSWMEGAPCWGVKLPGGGTGGVGGELRRVVICSAG